MPAERELRFTPEDVRWFAAASGDRNPLHLDPAFARRTPFGQCIAHGALVALGMLGALPGDELSRVGSLRVWFAGPVIPGATCRLTARPAGPRAPEAWEVSLTGRGKQLARLLAGPASERIAPGLEDLALAGLRPTAGGVRMRTAPAEIVPGDLVAGQAIAGDYRTGEELPALAARFGAGELDPALLEGVAWASYVVGMELPGLHSLFSGLTLAAAAGIGRGGTDAGRFEIELRDHDERTGRLEVTGVLADPAGDAMLAARIESFTRVPTAGPDPAALGLGSASDPASSDRGAVVVIGASRGFGAALSLALLARGFEVHGAYTTSSEHAAELVRLAGAQGERLHLRRLDAGDPGQVARLADDLASRPLAGLALNAALPPLPMGLTPESARDLADYVAASIVLAATPLGALLPLLSGDRGWVMLTSSSALSAPPRDWPHYVTAKAALEGLASWVAATSPGLRTVVVRPPAMRTEMTNTPSGRIAPVATETIASWVADRLAGGELPAGLSTLEPGTVAAEST
jgi:NAD(P)-dependent dehydrogenase (short-subunit alcohol dehydrogenase family)